MNDIDRRRVLGAIAFAGPWLLAGCGGGGGSGAAAPAAAPDGTAAGSSVVAYRLQLDPPGIAAFSQDTATGVLAPLEVVRAVSFASELAVRPDGRFVHVRTGGSITTYQVQPTTGALRYVADQASDDSAVGAIVVDPRSRFLFKANIRSVTSYRLDPQAGTLARVGQAAVGAGSGPGSYPLIAVHPDGTFLYATDAATRSVTVFAIGADGQLAARATTVVAAPDAVFGQLVMDPRGEFLFLAVTDGPRGGVCVMLEVERASGALTTVSVTPLGSATGRLAIEPAGRTLYASGFEPGQLDWLAVQRGTGTLSRQGAVDGAGAPQELGVDPSGRFLYLQSGSYLATGLALATYALDAASGRPTFVRSVAAPQQVRAPAFATAPR